MVNEAKQKVFAAIANIHGFATMNLPNDRDSAIVLTKLDEAMLWLMRDVIGSAVTKAMESQPETAVAT